MTDPRPLNCRFRLKDEGKPYPRSSCDVCGRSVLSGMGKGCTRPPIENYPPDDTFIGTQPADRPTSKPLADFLHEHDDRSAATRLLNRVSSEIARQVTEEENVDDELLFTYRWLKAVERGE